MFKGRVRSSGVTHRRQRKWEKKREISCCHTPTTLRGQIINATFRFELAASLVLNSLAEWQDKIWFKNASIWTVFPRPISSAIKHDSFSWKRRINHWTAISWYTCRRRGVTTDDLLSVAPRDTSVSTSSVEQNWFLRIAADVSEIDLYCFKKPSRHGILGWLTCTLPTCSVLLTNNSQADCNAAHRNEVIIFCFIIKTLGGQT